MAWLAIKTLNNIGLLGIFLGRKPELCRSPASVFRIEELVSTLYSALSCTHVVHVGPYKSTAEERFLPSATDFGASSGSLLHYVTHYELDSLTTLNVFSN